MLVPVAGKKTSTATASTVATATAGVQPLKIDDEPLPRSKNLNVFREWKDHPNRKKNSAFVVVGHIDHGKSTLMGRMLVELGVVEHRTVKKLQKEAEGIGKGSFAYAWVVDTGSEERKRGVTVDIAVISFETETTSFVVLDAPGHADFIPNMIAGTTYADFAILVVDAAKGGFESGLRGQTREHALLLRSMGINRVIVGINKMDAVQWSRERFEEISDQMRGMMKALKFRQDKITCIPVSGLQGDNLVKKVADPAASWYTGNTLLEDLETKCFDTETAITKPLRLEVADCLADDFQSKVTVTGRVRQGHMQIGDAVLLQPSGEKAYVKTLTVNDKLRDWVVAGEYVKLSLSHIGAARIRLGDVICSMSDPVMCVKSFTMKGLAFDTLMPMTVEIVRGRMQLVGDLRLVSLIHGKTGEIVKLRPRVVKPGQFARFEVRLKGADKPPLETGQRVIIRGGSLMQPLIAGLVEDLRQPPVRNTSYT